MSAGAGQELTYRVPSMSCEHCRAAISTEVGRLAGVSGVDVDLISKRVTVTGPALADELIRAAIDDAGYDIA